MSSARPALIAVTPKVQCRRNVTSDQKTEFDTEGPSASMHFLSNLPFFRTANRAMRVKGYYLLRNYKATRRVRIERAIRMAGLNDLIAIHDVAYGQTGVLPDKIAVLCKRGCAEAEGLFFQFYQIAKAEERRYYSDATGIQKAVLASDLAG